MRFGAPDGLWALLTVPVVAGFLVWAWRRKQALIAQFIQARLLSTLTVGVSHWLQKARLALVVAAVTLLLLALARPQWGFIWEEARQKGLDVVVAIDTSRSMLAQDLPPNRLVRAKLAALDLLRLAKSDRLGLVAFAGTAFLQCPLTLDEDAFRQSLDALDPTVMPQGGTAIADAIDTAITAFATEGEDFKVLVLLTDGEDHDSGAVEAAQRAAQRGLRIFTIGVATQSGELIRVKDDQGRETYLKDEAGNVIQSRLNEQLLQQIAGAANGFYLPLRGATAIDTLYQRGLAPLPRAQSSTKLVRIYHERYQWFVALALLVLTLEVFLPDRLRFRRRGRVAGRSAATAAAVLLTALIFGGATDATASAARGLREFDAGRFENALREYEQSLKKKPDDARLHFNAGGSAYRLKKFDEAANHFEAALGSDDLKLQQQARYNWANSLFRDGEQQSDVNAKMKSWQESLQRYQEALQLDPKDADAQFNHTFVKRKLEELKQQQQQQQQQQQKQDDQQDKNQPDKDQQNDPQKQQDKQNQQSEKRDDSSSKSQEKQEAGKDQDQQQKQQQPQQQNQQQSQSPNQKDSQPSPSGEQPKPDAGSEPKPDRQSAAGPQSMRQSQLTPEQARQLLEAQRGEEKALIFLPPGARTNAVGRRFRDW